MISRGRSDGQQKCAGPHVSKGGKNRPYLRAACANMLVVSCLGLRAVISESLCERLRYNLRRTAFEIAAFEKLYQLAVLQKTDRGRRRHVTGEVLSRCLGSVNVRTGENRDRTI